ncbi:uncharacterized protein LOC141853314 [Brevipalpus obovatus]|uniref:uncharacterized protein LOC141853314 n=1 Tax=Brevipalpus obovatus TaxID=246614 RepID=UPI003D9F8617
MLIDHLSTHFLKSLILLVINSLHHHSTVSLPLPFLPPPPPPGTYPRAPSIHGVGHTLWAQDRFGKLAAAPSLTSSVPTDTLADPPLPSGLFIPADQVHIYDFANNYPEDGGYYDYEDEELFEEKLRQNEKLKMQKQQAKLSHNLLNGHHPHHHQVYQNILNNVRSKYATSNNNNNNNNGKSSSSSSSGDSSPSLTIGSKATSEENKAVMFDDDGENRSSHPKNGESNSNRNNNNNDPSDNNNNNLPPPSGDTSALDSEKFESKKESSSPTSTADQYYSNHQMNHDLTIETASQSPLADPNSNKQLPVEVSRHTITSPNGDMTVVTEMVYKNPFKPTPIPPVYHAPYLPSSREGIFTPTDDPRLSQSTVPFHGFGLTTSGSSSFLPSPPRRQPDRDLATPAWSDQQNILPTPPTPYFGSTVPTRMMSSSRQSRDRGSTRRPSRWREESGYSLPEKRLGPSAIAGIVIGSLVFVALLAGAALFIMYKRPGIQKSSRLSVTPEVNNENTMINSGPSESNVSQATRPMRISKVHRWPPPPQ